MSSYTVENIIESFPNSSIPIIEGEPTYDKIKQIKKLLIENASSIQTTLGGGNYGYLGLILKLAKYQTVTGHQFQPHPNPGALPVIPHGTTQHQILSANAQHKESLRLWREQNIIIKALKNQLTGSVDKKYIADLHETYTGYNNVSIQDLFDYLYTNYGDLDEGDLATIEESMNLPYDPMEPFSVFITRIEDGMDLAEATGAPYSENQIVKKAVNLIVKAQCFPEGVCEWKRKVAID